MWTFFVFLQQDRRHNIWWYHGPRWSQEEAPRWQDCRILLLKCVLNRRKYTEKSLKTASHTLPLSCVPGRHRLQSDTLRGDLMGENILFLLSFKFKCNFNLPFPVVRMPRRTALPRPLSGPSVLTSGRTGVQGPVEVALAAAGWHESPRTRIFSPHQVCITLVEMS